MPQPTQLPQIHDAPGRDTPIHDPSIPPNAFPGAGGISEASNPDGAKNRRFKRPAFSAAQYFMLAVSAFLVLLVLTNNLGQFARYLYSPYSAILLIVIAAMYLMQEGSNRSQMYRKELRTMRQRRLRELQFYRQVEKDLERVAETLNKNNGAGVSSTISDPATPDSATPKPADLDPAEIKTARQDVEAILDRLRGWE